MRESHMRRNEREEYSGSPLHDGSAEAAGQAASLEPDPKVLKRTETAEDQTFLSSNRCAAGSKT